jgi:short-subunit dehydrogenase
MSQKAIVIGASSGIGRELALTLAKNGYQVGLMARRMELLQALQNEIPSKTYIEYLDISLPEDAVARLERIMQEMGDVDLIIINSGIGFLNPELDWQKEKQTLNVNVYGFTVLAGVAFNYFLKRGHGSLVGISSIAALRGGDTAPAYFASKAYMSNYLEGLRKKAFQSKAPITVTDIRPGYVDTEMAKGDKKFWMASSAIAAKQIYSAIQQRKSVAYITRRWRLIAWIMKVLPEWLYFRT